MPLPESIALLPQSYLPLPDNHFEVPTPTSTPPEDEDDLTPALYPVTATGGTFDHLHAGHKILLSMAAWITGQKLIVGITGMTSLLDLNWHHSLLKDDVLLQSKVNKHILEPIATRSQRVHDFLRFFKPEIYADIVPITDVYGPTAWDPDIQSLVVSRETIGGGYASRFFCFLSSSHHHKALAVAKLRAAKNLPPLHTFLIDVISSTSASIDPADTTWLKENKLSSTFIRQWIVDNEKH